MSKIKNILIEVQSSCSCHQKYLKVLETLYNKTPFEEFVGQFMKCITIIFFKDTEKNSYVERVIDFCAKFVASITASEIEMNDEELLDDAHPFLSRIISETLKFHNLIYVYPRYYSCKFITLILKHTGAEVTLNNDTCDLIQNAMLERIADTKSFIRVQALLALVRLQDPNNPDCPVTRAYLGCMMDINPHVRKEVVLTVAPNALSILKIKERIRDTEAAVRAAAFQRCADLRPTLFKIVDRQLILRSGFNESVRYVRIAFLENLLPKWLTYYNGDYLQFLNGITLDADEDDIKNTAELSRQLMEVFFRSNSIKDIISSLPIGNNKLLPLTDMKSETVMYWCIVTNYLRKIGEEGEEYLNNLLPELTPFCHYIESYMNTKSSKTMDEWEYLDYQFNLMYLLEIGEQYDFSDEFARKTFKELIITNLQKYKFQMRVVSKMVSILERLIDNEDAFTNEMCQIISEIREPLVQEQLSQEKMSQMQFQLAQLKVKRNRLEGDKEDAIDKQEFEEVAKIQTELAKIVEEIEKVSSSQANGERVRVVREDPETICQCLDLLLATVQLPRLKKVSSALRTVFNEFLLSLFTVNNVEIHWRALKCLTLYSAMDEQIALEHAKVLSFPIATYRTIPNYNKNALIVSVMSLSDLIRLYGVGIFGVDEKDTTTQQNQTKRRLFRNEDMDDVSVVNQNNVSVEFLIEIILDMLDDENEEITDTAVVALSKLILNGFSVNPMLISRMILKWYSPLNGVADASLSSKPAKQRKLENEKHNSIQQQLGLVIKEFTDRVKGAREVIEQAVIPTLTTIANAPRTSPLADIDVDNMLKFLAVLTNTSGTTDIVNIHTNMAHSLCSKIATNPEDSVTVFLAKMLMHLTIPNDNVIVKELIRQAEVLVEEIEDKSTKRYICKFVNKLQHQPTNETANSTNATTENSTNTNTITEKSHPPRLSSIREEEGEETSNVDTNKIDKQPEALDDSTKSTDKDTDVSNSDKENLANHVNKDAAKKPSEATQNEEKKRSTRTNIFKDVIVEHVMRKRGRMALKRKQPESSDSPQKKKNRLSEEISDSSAEVQKAERRFIRTPRKSLEVNLHKYKNLKSGMMVSSPLNRSQSANTESRTRSAQRRIADNVKDKSRSRSISSKDSASPKLKEVSKESSQESKRRNSKPNRQTEDEDSSPNSRRSLRIEKSSENVAESKKTKLKAKEITNNERKESRDADSTSEKHKDRRRSLRKESSESSQETRKLRSKNVEKIKTTNGRKSKETEGSCESSGETKKSNNRRSLRKEREESGNSPSAKTRETEESSESSQEIRKLKRKNVEQTKTTDRRKSKETEGSSESLEEKKKSNNRRSLRKQRENSPSDKHNKNTDIEDELNSSLETVILKPNTKADMRTRNKGTDARGSNSQASKVNKKLQPEQQRNESTDRRKSLRGTENNKKDEESSQSSQSSGVSTRGRIAKKESKKPNTKGERKNGIIVISSGSSSSSQSSWKTRSSRWERNKQLKLVKNLNSANPVTKSKTSTPVRSTSKINIISNVVVSAKTVNQESEENVPRHSNRVVKETPKAKEMRNQRRSKSNGALDKSREATGPKKCVAKLLDKFSDGEASKSSPNTRRSTRNNSVQDSVSSLLMNSRMLQPVAESTRRSKQLVSQNNTSQSSIEEITQIKRRKKRGRPDQILDNLNTIIEKSREMTSDDDVFDSPRARRRKVVETSTDSELSPQRKSARKVKKKMLDDYI